MKLGSAFGPFRSWGSVRALGQFLPFGWGLPFGCCLLWAAIAHAGDSSAEALLLEARYTEQVKGDLDAARALYKRALEHASTDKAKQAELRVRIAYCFIHAGVRPSIESDQKALAYLAPSIYSQKGISEGARREAAQLRALVRSRRPERGREKPGGRDRANELKRLVAGHLADARRNLARNHLFEANGSVQKARALDPDNADARALEAQIQTRLSGIAAFLDSPLAFLKAWNAAQVKSVARRAREHLRNALSAYRARDFRRGEEEFAAAVVEIDGCEFADASTDLIELRETVREQWRTLREHHYGKARAEPSIPIRKARGTPAADYVKQLQRMLDFISSSEHEYRLIPVTTRRRSTAVRGEAKPDGFVLERQPVPSAWTLARFARLYLPRNVAPASWSRRGNFLDTAGDMIVARNRASVLDEVEKAVGRLEAPELLAIPTEFLLVSIPDSILARFEKRFGRFKNMGDGADGMLARIITPDIPLENICGWLRDENVGVRIDRDRFETSVGNGQPITLLAGRPIGSAHGYRKSRFRNAAPIHRDYGVLLDLLAWREGDRTALALDVDVRQPVPPTPLQQRNAVPRFLTQHVSGYAELPAGSTLAIAGLVDPFAPGRGELGAGRSLLLLWRSPARRRVDSTAKEGDSLDIPVRRLLYDVHTDDPGPKVDTARGFVPVPALDVLARRASFLEGRMRLLIPGVELRFNWQDGLLRVPSAAKEKAAEAVATLELEARRTFVVELEARVVKTSVFQRWMNRENIQPKSWGEAQLASSPAESGAVLLRHLPATVAGDPFAPRARWGVLGLQARHLRSTRTRTSPAPRNEDALARHAAETVTEGIRITVRPYLIGGRNIRAEVSIATAGLLQAETGATRGNEPPAYQPVVAGIRVEGTIDFGTRTAPRTAVVCRIPHPTDSRPEQLLEIVLALNIRLQ